MKLTHREYYAGLCLMLILLAFPFKASAAALTEWRTNTPVRTVRIAISQTDASLKNSERRNNDKTVEYLEELSKYTGWKMEYVYMPANELYERFLDGEADLTVDTLKNDDTIPYLDFPVYNSGYSYTVLITDKSETAFRPMEYSTFSGMKVGVFSKAFNRISDYETFIMANDIKTETIYFDSSEKLNDAFQNGEIDAILSNDSTCTEDQQIIAKFAAVPLYFAVAKGNSELLRELNTALDVLNEVNPQFDSVLASRSIPDSEHAIAFTEQEQSFIKDLGTLQVGVIKNLPPIESYDPATGAYGISPDILDVISQKTGLKFEYVPIATMSEANELLIAGKVDIITGLYETYYNNPDYVYTLPYLDSQQVLIENSVPQKSGQNVAAVLSGYDSSIPDSDLNMIFDTVPECLDAVVSGRVDHMTINNLLISQYVGINKNNRITLTILPGKQGYVSFALARPIPSTLISVMDKAIHSISAEEVQNIIYSHTVIESPKTSWEIMFYQNPFVFIGIIIVISIIIIGIMALFLLLLKSKLKLVREKHIRNESYRIVSELTGEQIFTYDYKTQQLYLPKFFADIIRSDLVIGCKTSADLPLPVTKLLSVVEASKEGNIEPADFSYTAEDGSEYWFQAVGTVQTDQEGDLLQCIGGLKDIQIEMHNRQRLERQANTDYLTNMNNRQYGERMIRELFESEPGAGALFVIDIDHFKQINDTLGHSAGDMVLQEFADLLSREFDENDITSRWGGDEFIVFLHKISDKEYVRAKAETLCKMLNREFSFDGQSLMLSVSVGIAMAREVDSYQELFKKADAALYQVKNTCRNGFMIA